MIPFEEQLIVKLLMLRLLITNSDKKSINLVDAGMVKS
jgi:hypothetical protein